MAIKPFWNHKILEQEIQIGMSNCWRHGEWYEMLDEGYYETFVVEFCAFSNDNINENSRDFIYWINGSGMGEFIVEMQEQGLSKTKFLKQVSELSKKANELK